MNVYTLKNGETVEAIPIGKSTMKIGDTYFDDFLTIVDRAPNKAYTRSAQAICKCKCGNYIVTSVQNLKQGKTKSCGCRNHEVFQNNGKKVGVNGSARVKEYDRDSNPFYILNKRLETKTRDGFFWDIICRKCGEHYEVVPSQLVSYTRRRGNNPCTCWRFSSKGVLKIEEILTNHNIVFSKEKTFSDCISPKGNLMKFDFWVDDKYVIEYDGEQHFYASSFGDDVKIAEQKLKDQQLYDEIKNQWCFKNNIPIIRIPYTHYENIVFEDLTLNSNYLLGDKSE